jgi:hypothetical protein
LLFGFGFRFVACDEAAVLERDGLVLVSLRGHVEGAYGGDFFAFTVDVVTEVLLHAAHCYYRVVAERLDHLQRGEEAVLVDALQDCV